MLARGHGDTGHTSSGLRSRQSGTRYGLSGSGTGAGLEPGLGAEVNPGLRFPFERWNRLGWGKSRGI